jgi:hypothetical protein
MQRSGRTVVPLTSVVRHRGCPGIVAYSGRKVTILVITPASAHEVRHQHAPINIISHGPIDADVLDRFSKTRGLLKRERLCGPFSLPVPRRDR